jgi:hypothetical protein
MAASSTAPSGPASGRTKRGGRWMIQIRSMRETSAKAEASVPANVPVPVPVPVSAGGL